MAMCPTFRVNEAQACIRKHALVGPAIMLLMILMGLAYIDLVLQGGDRRAFHIQLCLAEIIDTARDRAVAAWRHRAPWGPQNAGF